MALFKVSVKQSWQYNGCKVEKGMKADQKRNFEAGILTDDHGIVKQAKNQFDEVWIGKFCKTYKRRNFSLDPIA